MTLCELRDVIRDDLVDVVDRQRREHIPGRLG